MSNINKITLKALMYLGCGVLLFFVQDVRAQEVAHNKGANKELTLRVGRILPPYLISENLKGTGQRGAEIDIISEALAFEGYRVVIVRKSQKPPQLHDEIGKRYQAKRSLGDIEMSMPVGNELGACYSKPYIYYRNAAMSLSSRRLIVDGIDDLQGRRVTGIQSSIEIVGTNFANLLSEISAFGEVGGHREQSVLLFNGISDFVVGEVNIFNWLEDNRSASDQDHKTPSIAVHPIFGPSPKHLVFRDRTVCRHFNRGLKHLKENGRYQEILNAYGLE